jgi:hypothetical protein
MSSPEQIVLSERIEKSILLPRGQKVMLDADLAHLYTVSVGRLNEPVNKRKIGFLLEEKAAAYRHR